MTTATMTEPVSLADACRWPNEFPAFVASEVEAGTDLRELLESPHKWDVEFARFLSGCNVAAPRPRHDSIAAWLESELGTQIKRETGGSAERPVEYREIEFFNGDSGDVIAQAVGDLTDYVSDCDEPQLVTGAKYKFSVPLVSSAGTEWIMAEATAYPERKHGRLIVTFELEACR